MMGRGRLLEMVAVVASEAGPEALMALRQAGFADAELVAAGDLAALISLERKRLWKTRKKLGQSLVSFQERLEAVHAVSATLPAAPGARFESREEVELFLIANAEVLGRGLAQFGDAEQHQLVVELPGALLLKRLAEDPAMEEARALMEKGERLAAGAAVQRAAEAERARLRCDWMVRVAAIATDVAQLPQPSEDAVLNLVALTPRGKSDMLEMVLEGIDGEWDDGLRIRMIGPSPASSFASVLVERCDPSRVQSASQLLQVGLDATGAEVKAAYRTLMKRMHPDVAGPGFEATARRAAEEQAYLVRVATARQALSSHGLLGEAAPLLATLHREGDRRQEEMPDAA